MNVDNFSLGFFFSSLAIKLNGFCLAMLGNFDRNDGKFLEGHSFTSIRLLRFFNL